MGLSGRPRRLYPPVRPSKPSHWDCAIVCHMLADPLVAAYNSWHEAIGPMDEVLAPWHHLILRHADAYLRDATILEIGCGRGGFTAHLASRGPKDITAADFSPAAVDLANKLLAARGIDNAHAEVANIQSMPYPDNSFDVVISPETIEHVADPALAVRELHRVLRRGGRIFLTTPNYLSTIGVYRATVRVRGRTYTEQGQPLNGLTLLPRTYWWFRRAGFTVTALDGNGHYLPVPRRARGPLRIPLRPGAERYLRWFALHSLVVATKC